MAGTKHVRIGRVKRFLDDLLEQKKVVSAANTSNIPVKRAYSDGKMDELEQVINLIKQHFPELFT